MKRDKRVLFERIKTFLEYIFVIGVQKLIFSKIHWPEKES